MKKLYRSDKDKVLFGIIGGLGEYFDIDPILLRLGFVVLVLITGIFPGVVAYIIALFIVPKAPTQISTDVSPKPMEVPKTEVKEDVKKESNSAPQPTNRSSTEDKI